MVTQANQLSDFLSDNGCDPKHLRLIAGDASNRKYYRTIKEGVSYVVMQAPGDKGENVRPFVRIGRWLHSKGLSAPEIFAADEELGFLILEDLGDDLFARVLETSTASEGKLYTHSADVLLRVQSFEPPDLKAYDSAIMSELAALAVVWYRTGALGTADSRLESEFAEHFLAALAPLDTAPRVLIQRDYHAENLVWLPDRHGVQRVGLLDFQDAMLGHPAYDLVSVLQDARRDVAPDVQQGTYDYFVERSTQGESFSHAYHLLGLQRNLRILGVFARLWVRDGKQSYLGLMPRVWRHVSANVERLDDPCLRQLIEESLPAPTADVLANLRATRT